MYAVTIDTERCKKDGLCAMICPKGIFVQREKLTIPELEDKEGCIACGHCVATIQNELNEIAGVTQANGDPQAKSVTVEWQPPATASEIESRLAEIGYPAST